MAAIGVIWADGVWDEAIWDTAIWAQTGNVAVDQFSFIDRLNQAQSATNVESGAVTLTNVNGTQTVTFAGDASLEWSKNGGVWSTGSTTVVSNDTMNLRLDASANYSTSVSTTMTVGSGGQAVQDTYSVVTLADPSAQTGQIIASAPININKSITRKING